VIGGRIIRLSGRCRASISGNPQQPNDVGPGESFLQTPQSVRTRGGFGLVL
jgi:hypothetical protein